MSKLKEIECPNCEGSGIIWFVDDLDFDGGMADHEESCPRCFGDGVILIDEDEEDDEY